MTPTSPTQGPWTFEMFDATENGDNIHIGPQSDEGPGIAHTILEGALVLESAAENAANARLIAAAPDLRDALVKARAVVAEYIDDCGGCDHSVGICMCSECAVLEQIDAALAKADPTTEG